MTVLTVAVATCHPHIFYACCADLAKYADGDVYMVVFANGCEIDPWLIPSQLRVLKYESVPENQGVPFALQRLYEMARAVDVGAPPEHRVVAYIHDDLCMREHGWNTRIVRAFEDPGVTLAGVLGSPGLGRDEIYRDPYEFWHLSRVIATWSNQGNAEVHGARVKDERDVVFVDGVTMFLRQSFLDKIDGWKWWPAHLVHHAYDYGLACMVRRHGGRVRLVPIACNHGVGMDESHGGGHSGTYGTKAYLDMVARFGGDMAVHRAGHRWVYDEFRDVLPLRMRG